MQRRQQTGVRTKLQKHNDWVLQERDPALQRVEYTGARLVTITGTITGTTYKVHSD